MVRLGLIGAGRWGRNLIRTIRAMDGVVLGRVASSNPATAELLGPGTALSDDWRAVIDAPDLDGVVIATPPQLHAEMACRAVARGLPALIEKPLCLDAGEAAALGAAVAASSTFAMVEHTHLYSAAFEALLDQAGRLGVPTGVVAEAGNWGPFRSDAPVLFDWGAHDVAMLLTLLGRAPSSVAARCDERRLTEGGEGASWRIELGFGATAARIALSNLRQAKCRRFCVNFATAALLYDDLAPEKLALHPRQPDGEFPRHPGVPIALPAGAPLERAMARFVAAVRRGEDDSASLALGIRVVEVLAACEAAA